MGKGSNFENWLCDYGREQGYAELRSPGSGTKDVAYPDVVLLKPIYERDYGIYEKYQRHHVVAFELKANSDGTAWFDTHEIEELEEWADRAGASAYIGVKPDLRTFDKRFFLGTSQLHKTENGYSFRKQDQERAISIDETLR